MKSLLILMLLMVPAHAGDRCSGGQHCWGDGLHHWPKRKKWDGIHHWDGLHHWPKRPKWGETTKRPQHAPSETCYRNGTTLICVTQ